MPTQYAPIYDAIAVFGSPYVLPPNWSRVQVNPDCRLLGDPAAALAQLVERFPAEDLLASGVTRQGDGGLVLNPLLTAEEPGLVVLRKPNRTAFDVMTATGCVSGAPPVLKVLHDRVCKQDIMASANRLLYGTFSMADTVLLRSLGVAVAPAAQLQSLHLGQLQRLLMLVGGIAREDVPKQDVRLPTDEPEDRLTNHGGGPDDPPATFRLALVAGSISALTAKIPSQLRAVARHLADAERHLKFSWQGIQIWYPTRQVLANLRYRRRLRLAGSSAWPLADAAGQVPTAGIRTAGSAGHTDADAGGYLFQTAPTAAAPGTKSTRPQ